VKCKSRAIKARFRWPRRSLHSLSELVSDGKGTAVFGGGEIFGGLLPEVVATLAAICDKAQKRWQDRVARWPEKKD